MAHSDYQLQQQNIKEFKELLQQSQTILENVKNAYLKGGTTIMDFLEAQRSWLDTQKQHFDALQSYRESYVHFLLFILIHQNQQRCCRHDNPQDYSLQKATYACFLYLT